MYIHINITFRCKQHKCNRYKNKLAKELMMNRINNNNYYFYNKIKTKLEQIHTYKSEGQRHQQKQNKQNQKKKHLLYR